MGRIAWFSLGLVLSTWIAIGYAYGEVVLNTQVGEEVRYLDPQKSTGISSSHIAINLFSGLYEYGHKNGDPEPDLAKSVTPNKDFTEYTVELNPGNYWVQNKGGKIVKQREITAEDVVYSYRRMLSPQLASEYSYMLFVIKNGKEFLEGKIKDPQMLGVKALSKYKVKITLEGSVPTFIKYLPHHTFHLVPREPIEKHGDQWIKAENIWTSAAFAFSEWKLKDRITVVKNPHFRDAKDVQVDKIHFRFIGTYSPEAVRAFRSGETDIDFQTPPSNDLKRLKRDGVLALSPQLGTYFFRINTTKPPLDNPKIRRALALTIPRESLARYVFKGGQSPAYSMIPKAHSGYTPAPFLKNQGPNYNRIKEAQILLAEAGYPRGKGFPTFSLVYNTAELHKKVAVVVAKEWKKALGITVKPMNQEWRVYLNNGKSMNYDIMRAGWVADMDDPMNFANLFISNGGNNNTGFANKIYDDLINKAMVEGDFDKRNKIIREAETLLMAELPVLPVISYVSINLKHKYVSGFYANKFDQHPLRYVKIDEALRKKQFKK